MYQSILVPLDGSTFAEHALPLALAIARRSGAKLCLAYVLQPLASVYAEAPMFVEGGYYEERIKARLGGYLDSVANRVNQLAPAVATTVMLEGEVVPMLQGHAEATGADLVVMTTHGRGPLGRLWLGSVADELLRVLPMPLLLVRPPDTEPDLTVEPPLKNILVPLDGTELAEQVLDRAVELGRPAGARFTLLRVLKPIPVYDHPTGSASLDLEVENLLRQIDGVQQQERREALAYLEGIAAPLVQQGLHVATKVAVEEQPGVAILHEAASAAVDLVALETHGRRGLSRLLLGSVADKVIRGATVPVLVHRAPAQRRPRSAE